MLARKAPLQLNPLGGELSLRARPTQSFGEEPMQVHECRGRGGPADVASRAHGLVLFVLALSVV